MSKNRKKPKKFFEQPWYWGLISESEAEIVLKVCDPGTFLVRCTLVNKSTTVILSFVTLSHKIEHIPLCENGRKWVLDGLEEKQNSVVDLISYYQQHVIDGFNKLRTYKCKPHWFLKSSDVIVPENSKSLGGGNFSKVVLGKYFKKDVAVKKLLTGTDDTIINEKESLIKEARVMEKLRHPYIIKMFGITLDVYPPSIVMELMVASLLSHLKNFGPLIPPGEKLLYCWQLVNALKFVAEKKIVHRDLAARNCLFNKYGILKLTDFGLSDSESNLIAYCTALDEMPVRWMAPETIQPTATFNEKTDVWSYGVVCNEIFGNGIEPINHITNSKDVIGALKSYDENSELHKPSTGAPREIMTIMKQCWKLSPSERPTFAELENTVDVLLKNKYIPPAIDEISISKIKGVNPLTIAEYDILVENHLDSSDSSDDELDDGFEKTVQMSTRMKNISRRGASA